MVLTVSQDCLPPSNLCIHRSVSDLVDPPADNECPVLHPPQAGWPPPNTPHSSPEYAGKDQGPRSAAALISGSCTKMGTSSFLSSDVGWAVSQLSKNILCSLTAKPQTIMFI